MPSNNAFLLRIFITIYFGINLIGVQFQWNSIESNWIKSSNTISSIIDIRFSVEAYCLFISRLDIEWFKWTYQLSNVLIW